MIDCGIKTQRECQYLIDTHTPLLRQIDAAVISHAHSDHVCYSSLRTLANNGIPVHLHDHVHERLNRENDIDDWEYQPRFSLYGNESFAIGDFTIQPMSVIHDPYCPNFGFIIRYGDRKIVTCTDFCSYTELVEHFRDADFIFVEANHDLELLKRFPNYASRFHMSNVKTAKLLREAIDGSKRPPGAVMLGHISRHRNTRRLAVEAVKEAFGGEVNFKLYAARLDQPSSVISV